MHEHVKILPKYMLQCHLGPTQTQSKQMEQSPIKKFKRFAQKSKDFLKNKNSQPFSKMNQTHEKPRI